MMKKLIPLLMLAVFMIPAQVRAAPTLGSAQSVTVPGGPRFWVANVVRDKSVTLRVENYDKKANYSVTLGLIGNAYGQGIKVGMIDGTYPANFSATFNIPSSLRGERLLGVQLRNNTTRARAYDIFENSTGWNSTTPTSLYPRSSSSGDSGGFSVSILGGPTFWIQNVKSKSTVTLKVVNYPRNEKFRVSMGVVGGEQSPGISVGLLDGSNGEEFAVTFAIPGSLKDDARVFIRLENNFTGNYGYVGFMNTNPWAPLYMSPSPSSSTTTWVSSGSSRGTPFTSILNVAGGSEVTLQTFNFPVGKEFIVTMGKIGTRGIGGTVVGVQNSGAGGSFIATYAIPPALAGDAMISIRLQSTSSGHYAYNWFNNSDGNTAVAYGASIPTTGISTISSTSSTVATSSTFSTSSTGNTVFVAALPPGVYPTFSIAEVQHDNTVTITTYNFTVGDTYRVYIGEYGSLGIGGVEVDTVQTGAGGSVTWTFTIPPELYDAEKLAIRLESGISGYYAYNWFENRDRP